MKVIQTILRYLKTYLLAMSRLTNLNPSQEGRAKTEESGGIKTQASVL